MEAAINQLSWAGALAAEGYAIAEETLTDSAVVLFDKCAAANWKVPWHQDVTDSVSVRVRAKGDEGSVTVEEFIARCAGLVSSKAPL